MSVTQSLRSPEVRVCHGLSQALMEVWMSGIRCDISTTLGREQVLKNALKADMAPHSTDVLFRALGSNNARSLGGVDRSVNNISLSVQKVAFIHVLVIEFNLRVHVAMIRIQSVKVLFIQNWLAKSKPSFKMHVSKE